MHFYGSASAEPFLLPTFPENWGARLRISGGCPVRGEPEALLNPCSSIACRAQPCQRCTPVLQALIIFQYASLRLCFGRAVFLLFIPPQSPAVTASPRGRLCVLPQSFPLPLKPSPWGRWHGDSRDGRGNPFREKGVQESPQTFLYPKIQILFPLFIRGAHFKSFRPAAAFTFSPAASPDSRPPRWPPG